MKAITVLLVLAVCIFAGCKSDEGDSGPPAPVAAFEVLGDSLLSPDTVTFDNNSTNADSFFWTFGNGDTSFLTNPQIVYQRFGTFPVRLIAVQTAAGLADTARDTVTVFVSRALFLSIRVDNMPFSDPGGGDWDLFGDPDVYAQLTRNGNVVWTSEIEANAETVPLHFDSPDMTFSDFSSQYEVTLYDDDTGTDDRIGSIQYTYADLFAQFGGISLIPLTGDPPSVVISLSMQWR
jgi:PKD repeat protein